MIVRLETKNLLQKTWRSPCPAALCAAGLLFSSPQAVKTKKALRTERGAMRASPRFCAAVQKKAPSATAAHTLKVCEGGAGGAGNYSKSLSAAAVSQSPSNNSMQPLSLNLESSLSKGILPKTTVPCSAAISSTWLSP